MQMKKKKRKQLRRCQESFFANTSCFGEWVWPICKQTEENDKNKQKGKTPSITECIEKKDDVTAWK